MGCLYEALKGENDHKENSTMNVSGESIKYKQMVAKSFHSIFRLSTHIHECLIYVSQ